VKLSYIMGNSIQTYQKDEFCAEFHITPDVYDGLAAEFHNLTGGADGIPHAVWTEAFCGAFGEEGKDLAAHYETIFKVLDVDKNDIITLDEYMLFQGVMMFGSGRQKLRALFAIADSSCDNVLSATELCDSFIFALKISNRNNPEYQGNPNVITDEQKAVVDNAVRVIFETVDTDKNGQIELTEFLAALDSHPDLISMLPFLF